MNDDYKDPNAKPADPNAASDADDNPWDEDDGGGRTLATDGPSFEMPSNIPSPITVPPAAAPMVPAVPAVPAARAAPAPAPAPARTRPRSPTMMGFGPAGPPLPGVAPAAPAPPARPAGVVAPAPKAPPASVRGVPAVPRVPMPIPARPAPARPAPAPVAAPAPPPQEPWEEDDGDRGDGPTMAGAGLMPDLPVRDDAAKPHSSPLASTTAFHADKDAETMALASDAVLPRLGDLGDAEETTRAVSREELLGHQEASVVFGDDGDAHGDEATLAVAPGSLGEIGAGLAAVLAGRGNQPSPIGDERPPSNPGFPAPPPAFPNPHPQSYGGMAAGQPHQHPQSQPQQPAMQSWQGEAAQSYRNPQQAMGGGQGYDPLLPQSQPGHQSSPGMQSAPQGYPMQGGSQPNFGPNPNAPTAGGVQPMPPMPGQQWMQPQPSQGTSLSQRFTPQVIMLVVVGAVCLSIFVIGIVLFVTTNFQRP